MARRVTFRSGEDKCVGLLDLPERARGPVPLVVMAGGWCYTKEIVMPHYARRFRAVGCGSLIFDYRGFGESSGGPRQHIDPWAQVEDYRNALSFAESQPEVDTDRLGVWGISYSGGHVLILAACDPRVRFAISTIPVVDGWQTLRRCHGERRFADLLDHLAKDRKDRFETGGPGGFIPHSSLDPERELSAWPFPHVHEIFHEIKRREAPLHEHRSTIASVDLLLTYSVFPFCARIIDTPVFMGVAKGDNITSADLEIEAFNAIASPNKEIAIVGGVSHMSLYAQESHLDRMGAAQAEWLRRQTAASAPGEWRA